MATPCEGKGYEVGQVFELTNLVDRNGFKEYRFALGTIVILKRDDKSKDPWFDIIKTPNGCKDLSNRCISLDKLTPLYPVRKPKEPVETITLFGNVYVKAEIESALEGVLPVGESL